MTIRDLLAAESINLSIVSFANLKKQIAAFLPASWAASIPVLSIPCALFPAPDKTV